MMTAENMKKTKKSKTEPAEFNGGLNFSRKLILKALYISVIVASLGIGGFLFYQEFSKSNINDDPAPTLAQGPNTKTYSNDYWGFTFQYPSKWSAVVSSFEDGDYVFASEPIDFVVEHSPDQALLEVKTYNNLKNLSFDDWLSDQRQNYIPPAATVKQQKFNVGGQPATRLWLSFPKPQKDIGFWDFVVTAKNNQKIYEFILKTAGSQTHAKFTNAFESIIQSVKFYNGFGT
jgi:hypothetical protein